MLPPALRPRLLAPLLLAALGACGGRADGGADDLPRETAWAYPISHVLVAHEVASPDGQGMRKRTRGEALALAEQIMALIEDGAPFAEIARARSDDLGSRAAGGFLGFLNPFHETRLAGAIQVLPVGRPAGPLETKIGFQILYRHSWEEGKRLEERTRIPVYGFVIGWREVDPRADRSREEAARLAEEVHGRLARQELTIAQAAGEYADRKPEMANAFFDIARDRPDQQLLWDTVSRIEPGALAPVIAAPGGFVVVARGRFFRSIIRHVLVQHVHARDRPLTLARTREQARERALEALAAADPTGANWDEIVQRYTDDRTTAPIRGGLGPFTNGELPPDLEAAILTTPPGRLCDRIAESPDGFHVLWRVN